MDVVLIKKKTKKNCVPRIFFKTLTSTMSSATSEYAWGLLSLPLLQSAHLPASVTVCPVGCVCSSVRSGCWVSRLIEAHCYCVPRGSGLMSPPTQARATPPALCMDHNRCKTFFEFWWGFGDVNKLKSCIHMRKNSPGRGSFKKWLFFLLYSTYFPYFPWSS